VPEGIVGCRRNWIFQRGCFVTSMQLSASPASLLRVENLTVDFVAGERAFRAVDGVSFAIKSGETFCLVGESGCGKTVTALSIARLLATPPVRYLNGEIWLNGRDVLKMPETELRQIRGRVVSYVFQEPGNSLNPAFTIGSHIKDALKLHRSGSATDEEVLRLLKLVGISAAESRIRAYPSQMSGGMQQRVMIAAALACEPKLLVADEPTTALDVTIQAQILDLLHGIKQRLGMSILLITHNLGIVSDVADRVAVMYAGQIVELAPARDLLKRPLHPYTRALINSVTTLGYTGEQLAAIPGTVPMPGAMPSGCRFHPRCCHASDRCRIESPVFRKITNEHSAACHFAENFLIEKSADQE
jgi:peptide/nickel transport system ATP-binding protein